MVSVGVCLILFFVGVMGVYLDDVEFGVVIMNVVEDLFVEKVGV